MITHLRIPIICLSIVLLVFAIYGRTIGYDFVSLDDNEYVYGNQMVCKGLTWDSFRWAFVAGTKGENAHVDYWQPMTLLSHMVDVSLFGLWPGGHHLVNVILHSMSSVFLFVILREMTGRIWESAVVAALWAAHPLRVESVAWVAERKDTLAGFFFMLTLWCYLRYLRQSGIGRYLLLFASFLLGLMCKPTLVPLPIVLLLLDYWPLHRIAGSRSIVRLVIEKTPLFILSGCSCLITLLTQEQALDPTGQAPLLQKIGNVFVAAVFYLQKSIWPSHLAVYYPFPLGGWNHWLVGADFLILFFISLTCCLVARRYPYLMVGWFWFVILFLPVSGIIQAGSQAYADRFSYLPQIGLLLGGVWLIWDVIPRSTMARRTIAVLAIAVLAIAVLGGVALLSSLQLRFWRDGFTLWSRALECTDSNSIAENNLGVELVRRGKLDLAQEHYEKVIKLGHKSTVDAHCNLGFLYFGQERFDDAISEYRKALEIYPRHLVARMNLGDAMMKKSLWNDALQEYNTAHSLDRHNARINLQRSEVLTHLGREIEAIEELKEAFHVEPDNPIVQNNLAWLLATAKDPALRDGKRALALAESANRATRGENPEVLETLAAARSSTEDYEGALDTAHKALELAGKEGNKPLCESLATEILIYEKSQTRAPRGGASRDF